jgi:hypothetical protein
LIKSIKLRNRHVLASFSCFGRRRTKKSANTRSTRANAAIRFGFWNSEERPMPLSSMPQHMPHSPRLSRSVKLKDHASLRTLNDVCAYMVALPTEIAQQPVWRDAAALALDARVSPNRYSMAALTKQIELALFNRPCVDLG